MQHFSGSLLLLLLCSKLHAGGLDRTDQSVGVLFENGRLLEFGVIAVSPNISGIASVDAPTPGERSGNIGKDYKTYRFAFKDDINNKLSYAVIYDEPFGAKIHYPTSRYFATGASTTVITKAFTGALQYQATDPDAVLGGQVSIFGGPRLQYIKARASVPFVANYHATADSKISPGYMIGMAWERPELGMRISLAYNSKVKSKLETKETLGSQTKTSLTAIDTPESINLEAQTGITPSTLLYGSIRWVPWADFVVAPELYQTTTGSPLSFFKDDRITYRIGLGRRIVDDLLVFGELGYEKSTGSGTTNLSPSDGYSSYTLGTSYRHNKVKYTVAARYTRVGDADTMLRGIQPAGEFKNNSVLGIGFRVSFDLNRE